MLKHLKLENFRSHQSFDLDLDHTTILVGQNGAGKTNILESLVVLSFCKSFREEDKKNLINYSNQYARVICDDLELFISKIPRLSLRAKERGIPRKITDFIGILPSVVFSPETISIITGAPSDRRRFLDIMISQSSKDYLVSLSAFKKIRHQRNVLLQRIKEGLAKEIELDFWDGEFVREAKNLSVKREEAIVFLNERLPALYQRISDNKSDILHMVYKKNYEDDLKQKIGETHRRDIAYGGTILGPHRDDIQFKLNGHDMANFASRGELKSGILALKIAELGYLEEMNKKRQNLQGGAIAPVLLLDDIFSEFDPSRREHLAELILKYQSVITSTEKENFPPDLLQKAKIIQIEK